MRVYFDLKHGRYTFPDVHGIEVTDLDQARRVALEAVREFRKDQSFVRDSSGWTLIIVDTAGTILVSIDLDSAVP